MYALFTAIPLVGHLNPLLRQAEEMQRRGWRVAVASASEMAAHVAAEAPDTPFLDLGPLGAIADRLRRAADAACAEPDYRRGALHFLPPLGEMWPILFDSLAAAIARDRPDVMVVDLFTSAGLSAADAARVPYVVNDPSLLNAVPMELLQPAPRIPLTMSARSIHDVRWWHPPAEPVMRHAVQAVLALTLGRQWYGLRASKGLPRVPIHGLMRDRTILVNGAFGLEYERPLPSYVHMVGPMLAEHVPTLPAHFDAWLSHGPPVAYANLGTVTRSPEGQLARMVEAFSDPARRVLWVVKEAARQQLALHVPPNIRIEAHVPSPRALLAHPNVTVFISHCGINSVYESLDAGTPVVGIPMLSDQRDMAMRVADAGVGVWMDKSRFTARQLGDAIRQVGEDDTFRRPIPALQAAFARAGGVRRAGDLIEAQMTVRTETAASL